MWSLGILCVLQFMAVSLVFILGCKPVAASWDFTIPGASCIDAIEFVYYCYYASGQSLYLFSFFFFLSFVMDSLLCSRPPPSPLT